jgi:hypothetical protein
VVPGGDGYVIYVGATGLPPVVRTWLHLHGEGPDTARVRGRYPRAFDADFDVVAFRLPVDVDRRDAKGALIRRLAQAGMLAETYVGDPPAPGGAGGGGAEEAVVAPIVGQLCGAAG